MAAIGICIHDQDVGGETRALIAAAQQRFDEVVLINPYLVTYTFKRGETRPRIVLNNYDISHLDVAIIRLTRGHESATACLARSLSLAGCDVVDPISRFSSGRGGSKLRTTISRFETGVGSTTYLAFSRVSAHELLRSIEEDNGLPLIAKPIAGTQGSGVRLLETHDQAISSIDSFFSSAYGEPILLQEYVQFVHEYRVLMIDNQCLGVVEKIAQQPGQVALNAAQGGRFVAADRSDIVAFLQLCYPDARGILGYDVGIDTTGNVHIIEANRAPGWIGPTEDALGINVADHIIEYLVQSMLARKWSDLIPLPL